jgi:hypothetical protein
MASGKCKACGALRSKLRKCAVCERYLCGCCSITINRKRVCCYPGDGKTCSQAARQTGEEQMSQATEPTAEKASHTPNVDLLLNEVSKLKALLEDAHPGLTTWRELYEKRLNAVASWSPVNADLIAACHGGKGAQPYTMPQNLAYYAELLQRSRVSDEMRAVMVHTLTEYSRVLNAAIAKATEVNHA